VCICWSDLLKFWTCIWELLGLNLRLGLLWFSCVLPAKCQDSTLIRPWSHPLQFIIYRSSYNLTLMLFTDTTTTATPRNSASSEANRSSATQETPHTLWDPKVHYCVHKSPPPVLILCEIDPVHFNIIPRSTPQSSKWSPSPLKPSMLFYCPPYMLHVPPISVFLMWSPELYLVRNTEHKAPCYIVFSIPMLPHPSSNNFLPKKN
jgi:hypothetical protein